MDQETTEPPYTIAEDVLRDRDSLLTLLSDKLWQPSFFEEEAVNRAEIDSNGRIHPTATPRVTPETDAELDQSLELTIHHLPDVTEEPVEGIRITSDRLINIDKEFQNMAKKSFVAREEDNDDPWFLKDPLK